MDYRKKLLDGRWQRKRLEILNRDGFCCTMCRRQDNVQIHHNWYLKNMEPWDYSESQLVTLCDGHHDEITEMQTSLKQLLSESGPELQREVYEFLLEKKSKRLSYNPESPAWALCKLVSSERSDPWLWCNFEVSDENGSQYFSNQAFGLWHENQYVAKSDRELFSRMCVAVDIRHPSATSDLHGITCWAHFVRGKITCFSRIDLRSWGDE